MIELLLDGDWVIYTAGFAGQKTEYVTIASGKVFANQTDLAKYLGFSKLAEMREADIPVFARTVCDPLDHVLHTAKNMIMTQVAETQKKFNGEDVHLTIFVDGDGNFRSRLGTIRPYKGTRAAAKPVLMPDIRQYLLDAWDAEVVFGQESDDAMAIAQTAYQAENTKSVICAVDKDMLQVPGYHRNPNKGWKKVSKAGGELFLYRQCLTGDNVDNIQGCYKCGPKAALNLLPDHIPEEDMWKRVVDAYDFSIEKYDDSIYGGLSGEAAALENMRLVYLRRQEDELWLPPNER